MQLQVETRVFASMTGCPRCGENHEDEYDENNTDDRGRAKMVNQRLVFWPLTNPQEHEGDMWAFCPTTNEPIVLTSEQVRG